jgi:hypothetical protein
VIQLPNRRGRHERQGRHEAPEPGAIIEPKVPLTQSEEKALIRAWREAVRADPYPMWRIP